MAKVSKSSVNYSRGMGRTRCKNCLHFQPPHACEVVVGEIDPAFWCEKFKMKHAQTIVRGA